MLFEDERRLQRERDIYWATLKQNAGEPKENGRNSENSYEPNAHGAFYWGGDLSPTIKRGLLCNPGHWRNRCVQTEAKIDGGRSRLPRASGDRLFLLKCTEGLAPKQNVVNVLWCELVCMIRIGYQFNIEKVVRASNERISR
ncbi:MAG: hypothetical protein AAFX52_04060 [Pseudomonadota bacterium]